MKSEPKAFASLSSGLLARKGAARPAMRPQGFGQGGAGLEDLGWNDMGFEPPRPAAVGLREPDADPVEVAAQPRQPFAGLTPVESPVHGQQAEIAERFGSTREDFVEEFDETAEPYEPAAEVQKVRSAAEVKPAVAAVVPVAAPKRAPRQRSAPGSKPKSAFTLRLDPERHLKLRLACAVSGRSAQQLVTDAVDQLLAAMPELDGMAAKASRRG